MNRRKDDESFARVDHSNLIQRVITINPYRIEFENMNRVITKHMELVYMKEIFRLVLQIIMAVVISKFIRITVYFQLIKYAIL